MTKKEGSQKKLEEYDPNFDPIVDTIHNLPTDQSGTLYFGCDPNTSQPLDDAIKITENAVDFVVTPISNSESDSKTNHLDMRHMMIKNCIQGTDMLFRTSDWCNMVVGKMDEEAFKILANAKPGDLETCKKVQLIFEQELMWAVHLSLPAVILPTPSITSVVPFAQMLNRAITKCHYTNIWINFKPQDWPLWNIIRVICEHSTKVCPILEFSPNQQDRDSVTERWFGEPVRAIVLDKSLFSLNDDKQVVLSAKNIYLLQRSFKFDIQIILRGTGDIAELYKYRDYCDFLKSQVVPLTDVEVFEKPYWDYLQSPLQPLMDNLESQTYEVFERDPVKYKLYEDAVFHALKDFVNAGRKAPFTLMVVGAGRGPLVKAAIRASVRSKIPLKLYAVDKNPNALVTLYHFKKTIWKDMDVTIIHSDMREWNPPEKADILVSELLGSFGDNELSPECLDGAQRLLKDDGVCIPRDYTSYISPLNSAKIYSEVQALSKCTTTPLEAFETAYVVKVHRGMLLSSIEKVFEFVHPNPDVNKPSNKGLDLSLHHDNSRYTVIPFKVQESSMMHGFIGYFECTLYKDVIMSIHPKSNSEGMFSWFPIVFPLLIPMNVQRDDQLQVHFWRNADKGSVWYEWMVLNETSGQVTAVHNANGRSYKLSL